MRALVLTDIRLVIGVAGVPGVVTGRAPSDLLLLVMLTRATFGHRDGSVTRHQASDNRRGVGDTARNAAMTVRVPAVRRRLFASRDVWSGPDARRVARLRSWD